MAGIYIHIPFCKQACYYCDFHFSTNLKLRHEMINAIAKEMALQRVYLDDELIQTVYFGGGTPSMLNHDELYLLLKTIENNFNLAPNLEITLEANPDDLSNEKLAMFRNNGVNRLSIGTQTFDDRLLKKLNRTHSSKEAILAIKRARISGFNNINLDIMYAIPDQSISLLQSDVEQCLELVPEHISAYSLTIEPKTVFGNWVDHKKITLLQDDEAARQMEFVMDTLVKGGYEHYEISNFCKPGLLSKHNTGYWTQTPYLGVGPGAHSYNGHSRQYNLSNNPKYIQSIVKNQIPFEQEMLTTSNLVNEYIFTTLRTKWGCDLNYLNLQYGYQPKKEITKLLAEGLVDVSENVLFLSQQGKVLADYVISQLFV